MEKEKESEKDKEVDIILRQTDYTIEVAREKLKQHDGNHINVIKDYLGVNKTKPLLTKSLNQQIYSHLRSELDSCMREYNERKDKKCK
jgi:RNA binding exosome subunit